MTVHFYGLEKCFMNTVKCAPMSTEIQIIQKSKV